MNLRGMRADSKDHVKTVKLISKERLHHDVNSFIRFVRLNDPDLPIYILGTNFNAMGVLALLTESTHEPVNGLLMLSPLGHSSHGSQSMRFQRTPLPDSPTSSRRLFGTGKATMRCPITDAMSVSMAPEIADLLSFDRCFDLIKQIEIPFGIWIGEDDEYINPPAFLDYAREISEVTFKELKIIPDVSNFDLVLKAGDLVGNWILTQAPVQHRPESFTLPPMLSVDDFDNFEMVGKGAFGRVFVAQHKESGRYVAIKVLNKKRLVDENEATNVIQERDILRALRFPLIVSYYGSFQDKANVYIVMDFVIGGELLTHLKMRERFEEPVAKFYAAEIILALEYLGAQKVVYRDLKPENVLLDAMGHIKLVDFGFARYFSGRCNSFCGTPEYISPEMISKEGYSTSTDIWSLGIMVYEMLTGAPPFTGKSERSIYQKILYSKIDFPSYISEDARDFLKRVLNPRQDERLGSGAKGMEEIKRHRWFKDIDWVGLVRRTVPSPYVPSCSYEGDTANFLSSDGSLELDTPDQSFDGHFVGF